MDFSFSTIVLSVLAALLFLSNRNSSKILRYTTLAMPLWLFPIISIIAKFGFGEFLDINSNGYISVGWFWALVIYCLHHYFLELENKSSK